MAKTFPCQPRSHKTALIAEVTGQDGSYLAELFLARCYVVHGIKRCSSSFNTQRIDHIFHDPHEEQSKIFLPYEDVTDATHIMRIGQETQPDEIYNLADQSHILVSFEMADYTANADALRSLRFLEGIRILGLTNTTRFYQASNSEMFGSTPPPQNEDSPFSPRSPYAAAKFTTNGLRSTTVKPMAFMPQTAYF